MGADLLSQATDGLGSIAHATLALEFFRPGIKHLLQRRKCAIAYFIAKSSIHADGSAPSAGLASHH